MTVTAGLSTGLLRIGDVLDFKSETDRLLACGVTTRAIANAAGLSLNSVARMRLDPSTSSYRQPPEDWSELLVRVSLAHASHLDVCSADLRALAKKLEGG